MDRQYPCVKVTEKAEKALKSGHPWVFCDEITHINGKYENGDIVDVFSQKDRFLGSGYINDNSKIRVRVISRNANDKFDEAFYRRRIKYAVDYRKTVMGDDFSCCRLIFGEADQFPGFTVDMFEDILSVQVACYGIERIKDMLYSLLCEVLLESGVKITAIYERNDIAVRNVEGLVQYKGFYAKEGLKTDLDGHVLITKTG